MVYLKVVLCSRSSSKQLRDIRKAREENNSSYIYIEMLYKIQYNEDDNVYYMPGILLDTLHVLSLILLTTLFFFSFQLYLFFLNWSIVDLQCCVNFCCTAKSFSYTHILFHIFPLWFIPGYWIEFPVLYNRTLLFIHPIYHGLHLLIPNSQSFPPTPPPPWQPWVCSQYLWVCFCFIDMFICVIF